MNRVVKAVFRGHLQTERLKLETWLKEDLHNENIVISLAELH